MANICPHTTAHLFKTRACVRNLGICNRLRAVCVSPRLTGFGWTPLYSWCGAFGPNAYSRINQPKPTCIWTGWRLRVTQKTILNTQCINHSHQGERDPKRRVPWCSLPNPELRLLLDPSLIPDPHLAVFQEKGASDDICGAFYIACKAWDDVHQWCKDCIIKWHTSPWTSSVGASGGKLGTLANHRHVSAMLWNLKI